jgi:hypothetical protein
MRGVCTASSAELERVGELCVKAIPDPKYELATTGYQKAHQE